MDISQFRVKETTVAPQGNYKIHFLDYTGYVSGDEFIKNTKTELNNEGINIQKILNNVILTDSTNYTSVWASNTLLSPCIIYFDSISNAANALKSLQRNWGCQNTQLFRRANLIQEKLPYINLKPKKFPYIIPNSPVGYWTILDENHILASPKTTSPFPGGIFTQEEDHENPPSRAYLKLQEALSLAKYYFPKAELPGKNSQVLDAGACPGGWTWVLDNLKANITAVDRSPLSPELMKKTNIKFIRHDAFTIPPEEYGKMDWVFSDVICYPERLLKWIEKWLESKLCKNFICTIKMQGEPDWKTIKEFREIPNSKVLHLSANKHELTWINCQNE